MTGSDAVCGGGDERPRRASPAMKRGSLGRGFLLSLILALLAVISNLVVAASGAGGRAGAVATATAMGVAVLGILVRAMLGSLEAGRLAPAALVSVEGETEHAFRDAPPALETRSTIGHLSRALDLASDGFLWLDARGCCTAVSPGFAEMLGYRGGELEGMNWASIVAEASRVAVGEALGLSARTGAASIETALQKRDGSSTTCRLQILAVAGDREKHRGCLLTSQPVPLKTPPVADTLAQAGEWKREAERASRAKSEFLATVGHEVRTPLNALVAVADLLAETPLDQTQRQYLEVLRSGSQKLLDLAADMLDLSRAESGSLRIEAVDFELKALLDEVARTVAPLTSQREIRLASSVQPNVANALNGDGQRIAQVLANLLRFAINSTERSTVNLRVTAFGEGSRGAANAAAVRFEISGIGSGMPADECNRLVAYLKGAKEGEAQGPLLTGQGLGLTLSKRLAEAMGGQLAAAHLPPLGTMLSLEIPLRPALGLPKPVALKTAGEPVASPSTGPLAGVKLLLVAAREADRKPLAEQLARAGGRVSLAEGAMSALLLLAQAVEIGEPFRLLVIDGRLCRVTGVETAQRLAAQDWASNPAIVILTAGLSEDDMDGHEQVRARLYGGDPMEAATFLPELCAALASAGHAPPLPRDRAPAVRARRVLVVDDNSTNLFLVKDFLKKVPGLDVEAVDGGEAAVDRATANPFDLILMDMQMPVVDGRTATRRIRKFEREHNLPEVPIIAFTAHSLEIELAEATAAGCNGHLIKPAKKQKVIDTVMSYLDAPPSASGCEPRANESRPVALPIVAQGQEQFRDHTGDYLTRLAESLTRAEAALKDHDLSAVREISHKWIGPGVGLGLPEISDEGGLLQNAARTANEPLVEVQLARIRDYTSRLQVVFQDGAMVKPEAG